MAILKSHSFLVPSLQLREMSVGHHSVFMHRISVTPPPNPPAPGASVLRNHRVKLGLEGFPLASTSLLSTVSRSLEGLCLEEWEKGIGTVVGSITMIYDYDAHNVVEKLAELQHQNHSLIHNSSQVRLDEHACLEVIIVQGSPFEIKDLADKVQAIKGVKHAELARCTVK